MIAAALAAVVLSAWLAFVLKKVERIDGSLRISNYLRAAEVPLQSIEAVVAHRLGNFELVSIRFRRATEFGDRVFFLPTWRLLRFAPHPVVDELMRGAAAEHASVK